MATPNAAAISKFIDIPVSYHTGVPNIGIPIGTISEGSLSLPISINYNSSGIRVDELASSIGLGWALNSGGVISRSVVGAPDESGSGFYTNPGYPTGLKDGDACTIDPNCATTLSGTGQNTPCLNCQSLEADIVNQRKDAESDIFNFSFGGYSGKFVFDNNGKLIMLTANDLKVDYSQWGTKWIFTTPQGVKYYFGAFGTRSAYESALVSPSGNLASSSWYLERIESADSQHWIDLDYVTENYTYKKLGDHTFTSYPTDAQTYVESNPFNSSVIFTVQAMRLSTIRTSSGIESADFATNSISRTDLSTGSAQAINQIQLHDGTFCKVFNFQQSYFTSAASYWTGDGSASLSRLRLDGLQEVSCANGSLSIPPYTFTYNSTPLPSRASLGKDLWGYYNGHDENTGLLPQNMYNYLRTKYPANFTNTSPLSPVVFGNRTPSESAMQAGILQKVTYPAGGSTAFVYEAHRLTPTDTKLIGGLRVKSEIVYNTDGSQAKREDYVYTQGTRFDEIPTADAQNAASDGLYYTLNVRDKLDPVRVNEALASIYSSLLPRYSTIYSSAPLAKNLLGYHIGYDSVTVSHLDGSTSSYKNVFGNYISMQTFFYPYPSAVGVQDNVQLITETHRNSAGTAVKIKSNYYTTDYVSQSTAKKFYATGNTSSLLYFYSKYSLNSNRILLRQTTDIVDGVSTVTNYDYNAMYAHLNPIGIRVNGSNFDEKKTVIKYIDDIDNSNPNYGVSYFKLLNMIGVPLETREYYKGNLVNGTVAEYLYNPAPNAIGYTVNPYKYYRLGHDGTKDLRVTINAIDLDGKPTQITKAGYGSSTYFYWTSNNLLFRITDKNSTYTDSLSTSYTYNGSSSLESSSMDVNGLMKKYQYDALMRLTHVDDRMNPVDGSDVQATMDYTYIYRDPVNQNFVRSTTWFNGILNNLVNEEYSDGLGRTIGMTKVNYTQSNQQQKMNVTYDNLGRQSTTSQPFQSSNLGYETSSTAPVVKTLYELSPLSRPITQVFEDGTTVQKQYGSNTLAASPRDELDTVYDNVRKYRIVPLANDVANTTAVSDTDFYAANTLYKTSVWNENGTQLKPAATSFSNWYIGRTDIFKDKFGRTILTRKFVRNINNAGKMEPVDTYYVYDDLGNLVLVSPPAVYTFESKNSVQWTKCYQYVYDNFNRLTQKRIPGANYKTINYDVRDLPTLVQDGNMRATASNKYLGSKYDVFGRPIASGWVYSNNAATDALNPVSIASTDSLTITDYYPNKSWVRNQGAKVLKATGVSTLRNFVWSFTDRNIPTAYRGNPGWVGKQHLMSQTLDPNTYSLKPDGRIVDSDNDHYGVDWLTTAFNGAQFPYAIYRYLFSLDGTQEVRTTTKSFFDNGNRLNNVAFDYGVSGAGPNNGNTPVLATMEYNYKDQLTRKNIGATAAGNFLQNIDYSYNTRGWLTNINGLQIYPGNNTAILTASSKTTATQIQNLAIVPFLAQATQNKAFLEKAESMAPLLTDVNADLFNEAIYYSGADSRFNIASQYNGNIQASAWQVANRNPQAYGYTYDELDRLTNAQNYDLQTTTTASGLVVPVSNTTFVAQDKFDESATYDKRGNILSLNRTGLRVPDLTSTDQVAGTYGTIDILTYTYDNQNRVTKIADAGDATAYTKGFKYANSGNTVDYTYDANGNLYSDRNKGITSIVYNFLNLPQTITFSNNNVIQFVYDASGAKLRKITTDNTVSPVVTTTTDYVNGVEYKNSVINRIANAEGQITRTTTGSYQREYDLKDHLGNTRVTFSDLNNDGLVDQTEILQINSYYGFGLNMEMNTNGAKGNNKYQYNGKEWNDDFGLGLNDYGARMYDPAIGRWNSVDPLAEKTSMWSIYVYAGDNPMKFIDPDGLTWGKKDEKDNDQVKKSEEIKSHAHDRIGKLREASNVLQKAKSDTKNADDIKTLDRAISSANDQVKELEKAITDIDKLGDDQNHEYYLVGAADNGENHVYQGVGNEVKIQGSNDAVHLHEIRHISISLSRGGLNFSSDGYLLPTTKTGFLDEQSGYRVQFSFNNNGIEKAPLKYIDQINLRFLGTYAPDGTVLYPKIEEAYHKAQEGEKFNKIHSNGTKN